MAEILQQGLADVLRALPELVPFAPERLSPAGSQIVICCAGFEDRAKAIIQDLQGHNFVRLIIVSYPTNPDDNAKALELFRNAFGDQLIEAPYQSGSFFHLIREMLTPFSQASDLQVVVDLSAMASYVIYRVLSAIWTVLPQASLGVYYAEAVDYSPTLSEWTSFFEGVSDPKDNLEIAERYEATYFQTIGVQETYESDVFPGRNVGPLGTEVIAIPSFSLQRMKAMMAFAEAQYNATKDRTIWFLGQPPDRNRNGWRFDALAALYNVQNSGVSVSTRNFRDILQRLDSIWDERSTDRHLVIAAMGSKMQHLGTFLFLQCHPECGLIQNEPREFLAKKYTSGIGPKWWIDFGEIEKVQRLLESRGDLRFEW